MGVSLVMEPIDRTVVLDKSIEIEGIGTVAVEGQVLKVA